MQRRGVFMDKHAQGLPITTVILAILGIVVLVILFAILTGRLTIFAGVANECPGVCVVSSTTDIGRGDAPRGILEREGMERAKLSCTAETERQVYGKFIAQVRQSDGEPIACNVCCQRLS